jgi:hypothetical protein
MWDCVFDLNSSTDKNAPSVNIQNDVSAPIQNSLAPSPSLPAPSVTTPKEKKGLDLKIPDFKMPTGEDKEKEVVAAPEAEAVVLPPNYVADVFSLTQDAKWLAKQREDFKKDTMKYENIKAYLAKLPQAGGVGKEGDTAGTGKVAPPDPAAGPGKVDPPGPDVEAPAEEIKLDPVAAKLYVANMLKKYSIPSLKANDSINPANIYYKMFLLFMNQFTPSPAEEQSVIPPKKQLQKGQHLKAEQRLPQTLL